MNIIICIILAIIAVSSTATAYFSYKSRTKLRSAVSLIDILPANEWVIVEPEEEEQSFEIIGSPPPLKGKVLATGSGKPKEPMLLNIHDIVYYHKHSATSRVPITGSRELLFMRQSDVLAYDRK